MYECHYKTLEKNCPAEWAPVPYMGIDLFTSCHNIKNDAELGGLTESPPTQEETVSSRTFLKITVTNFMAYGNRWFNSSFTRVLRNSLSRDESI